MPRGKASASDVHGYRVLATGINYPDPQNPGAERRAERDEIVTDLPEASLPWLIKQGLVEAVPAGGGEA